VGLVGHTEKCFASCLFDFFFQPKSIEKMLKGFRQTDRHERDRGNLLYLGDYSKSLKTIEE
jgi:hypothetical protein